MKSKALVLILAVVFIGGIWFLWTTSSRDTSSTSAQKEFTLIIAKEKLVSGPTVLSVNQGDTVVIHIQSDEAGEFHLHGYDRAVDLISGTTTTLTVVADTSGRFPYELEESKSEIGALEVQPK